MPSADDVKVLRVSPELTGSLWPAVVPWLKRGMKTATDLTLASVRADLANRHAELWVIALPGELLGAFLTSTYRTEDGREYVGVYGLGGTRLRLWAAKLDDTMRAFARAQGVASVRFHGRKPWVRALRDGWAVVGSGHGVNIFEARAA